MTEFVKREKRTSNDYLLIPVSLFKGLNENPQLILEKVLNYCYYDCYNNLEGDQESRFKQIEKKLPFKFYNAQRSYENGKDVFETISPTAPRASISKNILEIFCNSQKTESDIKFFLAFMAFRSIIQRQPYAHITDEYLISRMAGNSVRDEPVPASLMQYKTRKQMDAIKSEMQLNWGLKYYGYRIRGYLASFKLEKEELVEKVEKNRKSVRVKALKQEEKRLRENVIKRLPYPPRGRHSNDW